MYTTFPSNVRIVKLSTNNLYKFNDGKTYCHFIFILIDLKKKFFDFTFFFQDIT